MNSSRHDSRRGKWANRILVVLFAMVVVPLGVTILYRYSPTDEANRFYPGCWFSRLSGLYCPGCGATRCCHALVHGDIEQALAWNPLFVLLLPYLIYSAVHIGILMWTGRAAPGYRMPVWLGKTLMWVLLLYWIARNIPIEPFTWLVPHELESRLFS